MIVTKKHKHDTKKNIKEATEDKHNLVTRYSYQKYPSPNQVLENLQKSEKMHPSWVLLLPAGTTVDN